MSGVDVPRARRWFWALTTVAILAMGGLYRGLYGAPTPGTGILVLVSSLALVPSVVQAARILTALSGPPKLPRPRALPARPSARRRRPPGNAPR